MFFDFMEWI